jgi:hypothetical protein
LIGLPFGWYATPSRRGGRRNPAGIVLALIGDTDHRDGLAVAGAILLGAVPIAAAMGSAPRCSGTSRQRCPGASAN